MNFYKHHIGDYDSHTAHLSWLEDAAYSRLMRLYYRTETALPADPKATCRLIRASSKQERDAVQAVLDEFFTLQADGWHNARCDAEIAKANAQAETNRQIAETREAKKRARTDHESLHESLDQSSTTVRGEREPSQTPDSRLEEKKPPSSAEEIFWSEGPRYLAETGTAQGTARTFLGMCVKSHGLAESMRALEAAMHAKTGDPRAYMTAILNPRSRNNGAQLRAVV